MINSVPDALAERIRIQFEGYAERKAYACREHEVISIWDLPQAVQDSISPTTDPTLEADLRAAGVPLEPGWTFPGLIGLPTINERVEELLFEGLSKK